MFGPLSQRFPILVLVLLISVFTSTKVDAFCLSTRHAHRTATCRSSRSPKGVEVVDDINDSKTLNFDNRRRGGKLLKNKIKKLDFIPTSKRFGRLKGVIFSSRQKIRRITERNTVYVLELKNGKYYVGSTTNRKQRYRQHFGGNTRGGSKWTRLHKPIRVIAEYKRIPSRYVMGMESQKTAEYMMKYGVNNVRGAAFCHARDFTTDDTSNLVGFLGHYNQLDFKTLRTQLKKVLPKSIPSISPNKNKSKQRNSNEFDQGNPDDSTNREENGKGAKRRNHKRKKRNKKRQATRKGNASSSTDRIELTNDDDIEFHSNVMSSLQNWLDTPIPGADAPKESRIFLIPKCWTAMRNAICQTIEREYPDLVLKKQGRSIVRVHRALREEKEEHNHLMQADGYKKSLEENIGTHSAFPVLPNEPSEEPMTNKVDQEILAVV